MKLITFTTIGSARLAANWAESVACLALDPIVYCADMSSLRVMRNYMNRGVALRYLCDASDAPIQWGTKEFAQQIAIAKLSLQWELNDPDHFEPYLFCDADTVLMRSPCIIATHPIMIQSDHPTGEYPTTQSNLVNIGVHYAASPVPDLFRCALAWIRGRLHTLTDESGGNYFDDQQAVCRSLEFTNTPWGVLNRNQWLNGAQYWHRDATLVHANWLRGIPAKEEKLKRHGYWFLDEERWAKCLTYS